MLKRILAIFVALIAGGVMATVVASPAQAEAQMPSAAAASAALTPTCAATHICLHTGVFWDGTTFQADPWGLPANTCFNFNSFWDNNVNSFWWNEDDPFWAGSYAEIYEGTNCSIRVIARVVAGQTPFDQMRSCNEGAYWDGPCGPPNNVSKRASSWAFAIA